VRKQLVLVRYLVTKTFSSQLNDCTHTALNRTTDCT